jgi:sulfate adenylyltransferase subunit 2
MRRAARAKPMSDYLHALEQQSIHVIREAYARLKPLAMLWSLGKDSNTMVWLVRKAFLGRVPFPAMLLDTGNEFPEVYAFRDRLLAEWRLDYLNVACPPVEATDATLPPAARAAARKTLGLKAVIAERAFRGILLGIRRDEQLIRGKERVFSPRRPDGSWDFRDQPAEFWDQYQTDFPADVHVRVHPLLAWTELDIWRYVERERIPVCELYFARGGKRYRSLGESDITFPIDSNAVTIPEIIAELEQTRQSERAGRAMDHEREDTFERLRAAGYM